MSTLIELTAQIVSAHLSNQQMTSDEMLQELQKVHASLKALEAEMVPTNASAPTEAPAVAMTVKQAFAKKDKVFCIICGKSFTTLKRHLTVAHGLKPAEYRKQFGIKSSQSLAAKNYVESRRQTAIDMNLGDGLARGRATRKANADAKKAPAPAITEKASVPVKKTKAPVIAVKVRALVPAKIEAVKTPAKVSKKTVAPVRTTKKK